jgi:hypothetical protein
MLEILRRWLLALCLLIHIALNWYSPDGKDSPLSYTWWPMVPLVVGLLGYVASAVLSWWHKSARSDALMLGWQTFFGLFLTGGYFFLGFVRANYGPRLTDEPFGAVAYGVAGVGMLAGMGVLACAGWRASRGLWVDEGKVYLIRPLQRREWLPAEAVAALTSNKQAKTRTLHLRTGAAITLDRSDMKEIAAALGPLPGTAPVSLEPATHGLAGGLGRWLLCLLLALPGVVLLAVLSGYLRMITMWSVGISGMVFGMAVGALAGYLQQRHGARRGGFTQLLFTVLVLTGTFFLAQWLGMACALPDGSIGTWVGKVLDGQIHETVHGYSRYSFTDHIIRPGPGGWIFFTLLDLGLQFFLTLVMYAVTGPAVAADVPDADAVTDRPAEAG